MLLCLSIGSLSSTTTPRSVCSRESLGVIYNGFSNSSISALQDLVLVRKGCPLNI